ncbi:hypothetical protein CL616_03015 [archaeon]|nr:hypothetical protein [archaeon]
MWVEGGRLLRFRMNFFPEDYASRLIGSFADFIMDEEKGIFYKVFKPKIIRKFPELICNELDYTELLTGFGISPKYLGFSEKDLDVVLEMELIRGYDLLYRDVDLPIFISAAETLRDFHNLGLVHRDIKPNNFVYDEVERRVKLVDFTLTVENEFEERGFIGTAAYASPEQSRGWGDSRSDIYSFGMMMYGKLNEEHPLEQCRDVDELLRWQKNKNIKMPHLHTIRPDIDFMVCDVVMRCLEKRVENRYQSMKEVVRDLKRAV